MAISPASNNGVFNAGEVLRRTLADYIPTYDPGPAANGNARPAKPLKWFYARQEAVLPYPAATIDRISQTETDMGVRRIEDGKEVLFRSCELVFQVSCITAGARTAADIKTSRFISQSVLSAVATAFLSSEVRALIRKYAKELEVSCDLLSAGGVRQDFRDEAEAIMVPASVDLKMAAWDEVRQPEPFPCLDLTTLPVGPDGAPDITLNIKGTHDAPDGG